VYGDRAAEPDETLFVKLSAAKNAKIADGTGVVTIRDDEPRVRINDASSAEGDSGTTLLTFTVSLSAAYDEAVTVNYSTADGSATTAGNDYLSALGTLTFAPGETSKTITVEVGGDATPEGNEYFFVNLSGASSNALLADGQGVGTILDDDGGSTPPEDDPCLWYNCHPDGGGYDTGNVTP
jgi:chitinase